MYIGHKEGKYLSSLQVMNKEVAVYVEGSRRPLTESSRLLRNVRKRFRKNKQKQEEQATMEMDVK